MHRGYAPLRQREQSMSRANPRRVRGAAEAHDVVLQDGLRRTASGAQARLADQLAQPAVGRQPAWRIGRLTVELRLIVTPIGPLP